MQVLDLRWTTWEFCQVAVFEQNCFHHYLKKFIFLHVLHQEMFYIKIYVSHALAAKYLIWVIQKFWKLCQQNLPNFVFDMINNNTCVAGEVRCRSIS